MNRPLITGLQSRIRAFASHREIVFRPTAICKVGLRKSLFKHVRPNTNIPRTEFAFQRGRDVNLPVVISSEDLACLTTESLDAQCSEPDPELELDDDDISPRRW